jgi:hypothetical protein
VTFAPSFFEGGFSALPVLIYNYAGRPQEEFQILGGSRRAPDAGGVDCHQLGGHLASRSIRKSW